MDIRPIDANALNLNDLPCYYGSSVREEDVQEWIESAPTLDYAPVKRGEWEWYEEERNSLFPDGDFGWRCSCCKNDLEHMLCEFSPPFSLSVCLDNEYEKPEMPFCPNCGARMKEDEKDEKA